MLGLFIAMTSLTSGLIASPVVADVDGNRHRPLLEAAGKPIAIIFIAHDCPVCNTYAPEIGRIETKYGGLVKIDIVYSEPSLTAAQAKAHAKAYGIGRAVLLLDPGSNFAAYCHARVTPQAVVYDGQGRSVYSGRIDDRYYALGQQRPAPTTHDLARALDCVLAGKVPPSAAGPPVGCFILTPHST